MKDDTIDQMRKLAHDTMDKLAKNDPNKFLMGSLRLVIDHVYPERPEFVLLVDHDDAIVIVSAMPQAKAARILGTAADTLKERDKDQPKAPTKKKAKASDLTAPELTALMSSIVATAEDPQAAMQALDHITDTAIASNELRDSALRVLVQVQKDAMFQTHCSEYLKILIEATLTAAKGPQP